MHAENFGNDAFDLHGRGYKELVDTRLLELRSGLFFQYPRWAHVGGKSAIFFLPFWENPKIRESNAANLAEYKIINRNGSLFAHTGTKSRKITVDFSLTLPHIYQSYNSSIDKHMHNMKYLSKDVTGKDKERFRQINAYNIMTDLHSWQNKNVAEEAYNQWERVWMEVHHGKEDHSELDAQKAKKVYGDPFVRNSAKSVYGDGRWLPQHTSFVRNEVQNAAAEKDLAMANTYLKKAADYYRTKIEAKAVMRNERFLRTVRAVAYLVDVIRSSIANNAATTSLSPPMIRIRNGVMYRDTPCLCRGYKIEMDDRMGMDLRTLMPYKLKISLDLVEVRSGDFGHFSPGKYIERDNVVGWESVGLGLGFDSGELMGGRTL